MFTPHSYGLSSVLKILYSQCCGIVIWKLNCLYRCWWNGILRYGHLLFATIKVIMHYRLYTCWQVPDCHVFFSPKGEQQMKHWSPFFMKTWGVGHKNSHVFFEPTMKYSQSNLGSIGQSTLLISCRFSKLSKNTLISLALVLNHVIGIFHIHNIPFGFMQAPPPST
jgi:hypothetical protein